MYLHPAHSCGKDTFYSSRWFIRTRYLYQDEFGRGGAGEGMTESDLYRLSCLSIPPSLLTIGSLCTLFFYLEVLSLWIITHGETSLVLEWSIASLLVTLSPRNLLGLRVSRCLSPSNTHFNNWKFKMRFH